MRRWIAATAIAVLVLVACTQPKMSRITTQGGTEAVPVPVVAHRPAVDLRSLPAAPGAYPLASVVELRPWTRYRGNRQASDGGLLKDYGEGFGGAGWQFTPVVSGSYCTSAYNAHLAGDRTARHEVLQQANALVRRAEPAGEGIVWRYRFANPAFGVGPGWISGMGQGLAMGCLAAAYAISHERRYLEAGHRAFLALRAPFGDDGTAARVRGGVFYEEVAGAGAHPAHILNGMIFALAGISFLARVSPSPDYRSALVEGIAGVRATLDRFFVSGGSLYDLEPARRARSKYHVLHGEQLVWLYRVTGDTRFLKAALRIMSVPLGVRFPVATSELRTPQRTAAMFDRDPHSHWLGDRRGAWIVAGGASGLAVRWCAGKPLRPLVARSADLATWSIPEPLASGEVPADTSRPWVALVWPSGGGCVSELGEPAVGSTSGDGRALTG